MLGLPRNWWRREVTRVVNPRHRSRFVPRIGRNNSLAALAQVGDRVGFAALDLSTGEFRATRIFRRKRVAPCPGRIRANSARKNCYTDRPPPLFDARTQRFSIPAAPRIRCNLHGDSPRRLDLRPRSCHSAARKSFRSSIARKDSACRPHRRRRGRRSDSLLRALHSARIARSCRPHRMVRAPELPGAGRSHGPQSGTD